MANIWELDFYSRPILDERQKKLWELLICQSPLGINENIDSLYRYSEFTDNQQVNSIWLRSALEKAIAQAPQPPEKIRFFRRQMNNMITKACGELAIPATLSRRTYLLNQWLEQRMKEVYPTYSGYQAGTNPSAQYMSSAPQPLPDALIGEKWTFVSLEAEGFKEMSEWDIDFGEAFPLSMMNLAPNSSIPGLIIYSSRAQALAAWMSGLELAFIKFNSDKPARLLLETGGNDSWILANLNNPSTIAEANRFSEAKSKVKKVHFLAVQSNPESESFAGFWLLQEGNI
ncbi:Tab2/Atab2 family RNA-binding protein [Okeania sp.]|uniref:Tab2/Atab2 family RNA-binding protein n=1 Tax=Okeania sp. TaxID=3100323 RepID=UPI002B4B50E2|nr:Tab2/Atab2 family RNA-binding protein [Okeania sp.]MEB3340355.1 Tab2/Atab2 family RNA-binding protein [Okeania sp.]